MFEGATLPNQIFLYEVALFIVEAGSYLNIRGPIFNLQEIEITKQLIDHYQIGNSLAWYDTLAEKEFIMGMLVR